MLEQQSLDEFQDGKLYDLFFSGIDFASGKDRFRGEKDLYRSLVDKYGQRVLEMCCGTGVFALDLAEMGATVTGVDFSLPMLEWAQVKDAEKRVQWIHGDATKVNFRCFFSVILCPGNAFQAFLSQNMQVQFLKNVSRHLKDDGVFVFNMRMFSHKLEAQEENWSAAASIEKKVPLEWQSDLQADGVIRSAADFSFDLMTQIGTYHLDYLFKKGGEDVGTKKSCIELRYTSVQELHLLLSLAGLKMTGIYSNYKLEKVTSSSDSVVVFCKKNEPDLQHLT